MDSSSRKVSDPPISMRRSIKPCGISLVIGVNSYSPDRLIRAIEILRDRSANNHGFPHRRSATLIIVYPFHFPLDPNVQPQGCGKIV